MKRGNISILLRHFGLMRLTDYARFQYFKLKNNKKNRNFLQKNPNVKLPPDYLMYESFQLDYDEYYSKSQKTAEWLLTYFKKYVSIEGIRILDWGCGPGRVIRHMPALLDKESKVFGTDYNTISIEWCKQNISGIDFRTNTLEARLTFDDNYFDVIFGISIFTHLSEKMHYEWIKELTRILKPGGILFLTTHGSAFIEKLTETEKGLFLKGELVERGRTIEGHRTFSAYHPDLFMKKLFQQMKVLDFIVTPTNGGKPQQDIWIVQKPK